MDLNGMALAWFCPSKALTPLALPLLVVTTQHNTLELGYKPKIFSGGTGLRTAIFLALQ